MIWISALPVDAVTVPTPGWVSVGNGMHQTAEGLCEGEITIQYALKAIDKAQGVRAVLNPDCSVKALRLVPSTQVTVGTTGPVTIDAHGYDKGVSAKFLESTGNQCTRISGERHGGGDLPPETPVPVEYGSGCNAGWRQTWSGPVSHFGQNFWIWDTIEAGLGGFGVPHCREYVSASDGSSGEFYIDCEWHDEATIAFSPDVVIDDRIEMDQIAFILL